MPHSFVRLCIVGCHTKLTPQTYSREKGQCKPQTGRCYTIVTMLIFGEGLQCDPVHTLDVFTPLTSAAKAIMFAITTIDRRRSE